MRDWMRDERLSKNMTQDEVSKAAGISQNFYANIENGKRDPSIKTAKAIADILRFPWQRFYE